MCQSHNNSMCPGTCPYCGGTGTITEEYYDDKREQMIQEDSKCLCQMEGTDEYNERIDTGLRDKAGLVYWDKNEDGDKEWVGTKENWDRYEELKNKGVDEL